LLKIFWSKLLNMSIILRIDVDHPYNYKAILGKIGNFLIFYVPFFPKFRINYLENLENLLILLNTHKIKSKIFFRRHTIPFNKSKILDLIKLGKHEICWHVDASNNFSVFKKEYEFICNKLKIKIRAFSKHGSGKLNKKLGYYHCPEYNELNLINWGNQLKLKEFYGNGENPSVYEIKENGLKIFSNAFWIDKKYRSEKYNLNWLLKESKKRDIVLLIHPEDIIKKENYKYLVNIISSDNYE